MALKTSPCRGAGLFQVHTCSAPLWFRKLHVGGHRALSFIAVP